MILHYDNMCIYIYTHTYTHMYMYIYIYIHTYIHMTRTYGVLTCRIGFVSCMTCYMAPLYC